MYKSIIQFFGNINLLTIIFVFIAVNLLIFFIADPSCYKIGGECAEQTDRYGYSQALSLIRDGTLLHLLGTNLPYTDWPPGYSIFLAICLFFAGKSAFIIAVIFQLIALLLMGIIAQKIVNDSIGKFGLLAMVLVIFNPNSLANAHVITADIIHGLLLTSAFALLYFYSKKQNIYLVCIIGLIIGLSTLIRPVTQIYIPLLFIIFPVIALIKNKIKLISFVHGAIATIVSIIIVTPWLVHMNNSGEGYRIGSAGAQHLFLLDNIRFLTPEMPGMANATFKDNYSNNEIERLQIQYPEWGKLSKIERNKIQLESISSYIYSWPFQSDIVIIAALQSTKRFFLSGGEGNLHILLGLENRPEKSSMIFYGTKVLSLTYSITLRIIAILGIIELVKRRNYMLLFLLIGLIISFFTAHLVHGKPRFRIPVEPELMIIAVYGFVLLDAHFRRMIHKIVKVK